MPLLSAILSIPVYCIGYSIGFFAAAVASFCAHLRFNGAALVGCLAGSLLGLVITRILFY